MWWPGKKLKAASRQRSMGCNSLLTRQLEVSEWFGLQCLVCFRVFAAEQLCLSQKQIAPGSLSLLSPAMSLRVLLLLLVVVAWGLAAAGSEEATPGGQAAPQQTDDRPWRFQRTGPGPVMQPAAPAGPVPQWQFPGVQLVPQIAAALAQHMPLPQVLQQHMVQPQPAQPQAHPHLTQVAPQHQMMGPPVMAQAAPVHMMSPPQMAAAHMGQTLPEQPIQQQAMPPPGQTLPQQMTQPQTPIVAVDQGVQTQGLPSTATPVQQAAAAAPVPAQTSEAAAVPPGSGDGTQAAAAREDPDTFPTDLRLCRVCKRHAYMQQGWCVNTNCVPGPVCIIIF